MTLLCLYCIIHTPWVIIYVHTMFSFFMVISCSNIFLGFPFRLDRFMLSSIRVPFDPWQEKFVQRRKFGWWTICNYDLIIFFGGWASPSNYYCIYREVFYLVEKHAQVNQMFFLPWIFHYLINYSPQWDLCWIYPKHITFKFLW